MAVRHPPYLLRLRIQNYRSLKDVNVRLQAVNVLVGANGSGKSNLLDVVSFLGDSARMDVQPALQKRGGFRRVTFRGNRRPMPITIEVEAAVTKNSNRNATDHYLLRLSRLRARSGREEFDVLAREEDFVFKRTAGPGRRITLHGEDLMVYTGDEETRSISLSESTLALATLPKLGPEQGGEQVSAVANLFASFRVFDPTVELARAPSPVLDESDSPLSHGQRLADDASNLAAYLMVMSSKDPDRFEALSEDARRFIPGLQEIRFIPVGEAGRATYVALKERSLYQLTPLADASFGSVRALALLALLYDPNPPKMTCIEEIDHGLHPYLLDRLVELIRSASKRTQFLIATHSPSLVNRLEPEELIVCERQEDGSSSIPAIPSVTVREMELAASGELGLGELWFSGALGGVPA